MVRMQHPAPADASDLRGGIHVLHVMTRYLHGGSERRLGDMIAALPEAVHSLVLGNDSLPPSDLRDLSLQAVTVVPRLVRTPNPIADASALATIRKIVRAASPDLVVTHQSKAGVLGRLAASSLRVPSVMSLSMANFGPGYPRMQGRLFRELERGLHRSTAAYAVVGHDLARRFERVGVPRDKLHVVRSGMRLPPAPLEASRHTLRERLGVPRSRPLLAYVGSLEARKNVLDLVPLVRAVRDDATSNVFLAVAGEGPLGHELERRIRSEGLAGDAALLGYLDDPLSLIAAADAVVLLSQAEGVPQVLVQAAAVDTPFIAYDVDGVRELRELGARGRIVPLGDRSAAMAAVREVLRWAPGEGGSSIDLSGWSRPAIHAGYRDLFASVLPGVSTGQPTNLPSTP